MNRIVVSALACLTLAVGAASAGAAPATGPDAAAAARMRLAWAVGPAAAGISTAPVYLAGSTYHMESVADPAKERLLVRVIRRDAGSGRRLPFATGAVDSTMGYRPVANGRTLFVTTFREQTRVWAFRPDGTVLWSRDQPGQSFPYQPMLAGPYLITVSRSGCTDTCAHIEVFAWRADDGSPVWSATLPGGYVKVATTPGFAALVIDTNGGNELSVFDTTTGELLWSRSVGSGGIAVDDKHVYVADGSLRAFGVRDGTVAWTGVNGGYAAAYASRYGIFVTSGDRYAAYDTAGRRRWWSGVHPRGTLTVDTGIVYFQQSASTVGRGPAYLVAMRASNGAVLSRTRIWKQISVGEVSVGGGRVFTKALNEKIVGFAPAPVGR